MSTTCMMVGGFNCHIWYEQFSQRNYKYEKLEKKPDDAWKVRLLQKLT